MPCWHSIGPHGHRAKWHALRQGGAGLHWARKPDLAYFKWWGQWQSTAVALQYATHWNDPAVIAPTILPAWERGTGPGPEPLRVGLASIWGRAMYPELARVVDTPTRRKKQSPTPYTWRGAPVKSRGRGRPSRGKPVTRVRRRPVRRSFRRRGVAGVPCPNGEVAEPLLLPYSASEQAPGAVAVEATVQLGAPDAGVGGAGGEVRHTGSAEGPILVDSMWTPTTTVENLEVNPMASPARSGGRPSRFAGRERPG